jgi:hypothetical protein
LSPSDREAFFCLLGDCFAVFTRLSLCLINRHDSSVSEYERCVGVVYECGADSW